MDDKNFAEFCVKYGITGEEVSESELKQFNDEIKQNKTSVDNHSLSSSEWWGVILSIPYAIFSAITIFISMMGLIGLHSQFALILGSASILLGSGISCLLPFIVYFCNKKNLDSLLIWLIVFSPWIIFSLGSFIAFAIDAE